jgi:hypothetical protein
VAEIEWIEAAGNYVQIYCDRKVHLVRHTVKAMEDKLDPERFVRVRPSAIVAVAHARALNARAGGDYVVVLGDGTEIRSSRGFRGRVEQALAEAPGTARRLWAGRRRRHTVPGQPPTSETGSDPQGARAAPPSTAA